MGSDDGGEAYREPVSKGTLARQVVVAIADVSDREPLDVPPLGESVDFEALAALVKDRDGELHVEFEHAGCNVTVADGVVTVVPVNA